MKGYCYPGAEVRRLISWDDYTNVPQANHQISSTGQSNRILCTRYQVPPSERQSSSATVDHQDEHGEASDFRLNKLK